MEMSSVYIIIPSVPVYGGVCKMEMSSVYTITLSVDM